MKARTLLVLNCACEVCRRNGGEGCERYPDSKIPIGTIIEHQDAYRLVRLGAAEPADDECEQRAAMTAEQMRVAQYHQRRTAAGIHPDDFDAFERGEMVGYYPDGSFIPGPNASHFRDDDEDNGLWLP
jgi:hypothetical protein